MKIYRNGELYVNNVIEKSMSDNILTDEKDFEFYNSTGEKELITSGYIRENKYIFTSFGSNIYSGLKLSLNSISDSLIDGNKYVLSLFVKRLNSNINAIRSIVRCPKENKYINRAIYDTYSKINIPFTYKESSENKDIILTLDVLKENNGIYIKYLELKPLSDSGNIKLNKKSGSIIVSDICEVEGSSNVSMINDMIVCNRLLLND